MTPTPVPRQASAIKAVLFALILSTSLAAFPQEPKTAPAVVGFSLDFPQSSPDHYEFSITSDGRASYDSTGKLTPQSDAGDPFHTDFTISAVNLRRIFDLAAKAKYFDGPIDSGKRNLASTGAKVLSYTSGDRRTYAQYNYSLIPAVQDLTAIFQNMSTTLEFGRRLDYYQRHQKLALEDELKRMEEMANEKSLQEIQAVAPILEKIVADRSVLNVSRARAQRLLTAAGAPGAR